MKKPKLARRDALIDSIFALSEKIGRMERAQKQIGRVAELRERVAEQAVTIRRLLEEKASLGQEVKRLTDRLYGVHTRLTALREGG